MDSICSEKFMDVYICCPERPTDKIQLESNYISINRDIAIPYSKIEIARIKDNFIFLQISGEELSIYLEKTEITRFYFNQILERI